MFPVVPVTDARGAIVRPDLLAAAEFANRQLRPQIPPGYVNRMTEIFAGGAEMAVVLVVGHAPIAYTAKA